jgi:hypothetical protein
MADIAVATAGLIDVVESIEQMTLPAGEAIVAGAPVRVNTSGQFVNGNGTTTTENDVYGIATTSVASGMPVTAIAKGVLGGFTFSQAYWAVIYVSDTDGRLGDAAGTASKVAGRVIPGTASSTYDKLLRVTL